MIYTEPLFNQISRFITSIGFGFIICILYFALFFIRKVLSDRRSAVIFQDVVFGLIGTIMSFFYMVIYNNGEVRMNLLIGEITGAVVLYCTLGKPIIFFLEKAAEIIRGIIDNALMPLKIYINAFSDFYKKIKDYINYRKNKNPENSKKTRKKKRKKLPKIK